VLNFGSRKLPSHLWQTIRHEAQQELETVTYVRRCEAEIFKSSQGAVQRALTEITKAHDFDKEIKALINIIVLLESDRIVAGSSFNLLGMIYLRSKRTWQQYCEDIVHECAHQYIFHIAATDTLCRNKPHERYPSPLRQDLRPIMGTFHAVFVITRIILFYRVLLEIGSELDCQTKIDFYTPRFFEGYDIIMHHAKLTKKGCQIMTQCHTAIVSPA